ncbi:MAG: hypothetical protein K6343_00885 [Caldisericaceae bacterium]
MKKYLGVAIEDTYLPLDILYYEAPNHVSVSVGDRVIVPLGSSNTPKFGFVLEEVDTIKNRDIHIKSIIDVVEHALFSKHIAELFKFTSEVFLIPIHSLISKIYGTYVKGDLERTLTVVDENSLVEILKNEKTNKKLILEFLIKNKTCKISDLITYIGIGEESVLKFVRFLEKKNLIKIGYIHLLTYDLFVRVKDRVAIVDKLNEDINKSFKTVLLKLLKSNTIYALDLIKGVKNGKKILDDLISSGIVEKIDFDKETFTKPNVEKFILDGGGLFERSEYLAKYLSEVLSPNGKVLIVVNELILIKRIQKIYENYFKEEVFVWDGKDKSLIKKYFRSSTKIFITTPFALFVDIPNLEFIVVEDASSKYHLPFEFNAFDTRYIAHKKSQLENISLVFSTYSLDDLLYYFYREKGFQLKILKDTRLQNKRIIDMRKEYKSNNLSPISLYLESKIRKALSLNENVALVLNRKPYSTYIVCRECGYIHRCPNCGTPLHFDSEQNILFCPVCGHVEPPIEVCPNCGSLSISYLGYGIQKLSNDIKRVFQKANLVILESDKNNIFYDSQLFSKTIFLGTEYLLSHLDFKNISMVVFVSADTFLSGSEVYSSFEAFRSFRQASFENYPKDVFLQTYLIDNYILKSFKTDNEKDFISLELGFRKVLQYPPYKNLIEIRFSKDIDINAFKEILPETKILGPARKFFDKVSVFDVSILTETPPKEVFENLKNSVFSKKIIGVRVSPTPNLLK